MDTLTDLSNAVRVFLETNGLLAILVVMLIKEVGVPLPVPSDLIMITAGIQAATEAFTLFELLLAVEFAMIVGGSAQFLVARGAGRAFTDRVGRLIGLTPERLDQALEFLQRRGKFGVFLGLNVPGARAGIIPAAGLAGLSFPVFLPAMAGGSTVFYGWHVALGYLVGPSAASLLENLHLPVGPAFLGLAAVGLAGWLLMRSRRKTPDPARPEARVIDRLHSWTHAACPACLTITAVQKLTAD